MSMLSNLLDRNGITPASVMNTLTKAGTAGAFVASLSNPLTAVSKGFSALGGIIGLSGNILGQAQGILGMFGKGGIKPSPAGKRQITLNTGDKVVW